MMLKGYGMLVGAMSLAAFLLMGVDKLLAKLDQRRIPEKTLLWVAALGGAPGAWLGLALFRHKTQHRVFSVGLPLLTVIQLAAFVVLVIMQTRGGLE